jgi:nicotinate-nucleotide adenylyltransferase
MAPFRERLESARRACGTHAGDPRIVVSDIESRLGTRHTARTLTLLVRRFPRLRFVWLMGADNLLQVPEWQDWPQIFHAVPVAVFARGSYCLRALAAKAARRFARVRVAESACAGLARRRPPAWVFLHGRRSPLSATAIRARRGRLAGDAEGATTQG